MSRPMIWMSSALALFGALGLMATLLTGGCTSSFSAAVGPNQDLTIISDFPVGDERAEQIRTLFGQRVATPLRPEARFKVERTDSTGFGPRKDWRNLIILADFTRPSWGTRAAERVLGADRLARLTADGAVGLQLSRDVWANGQTVLFFHAPSADAVGEWVEREGADLVARYEDSVIEGLMQTSFLAGEQAVMASGIAQRHGFALRIPKEYVVEEQAENRFVRIKTMQPNGVMLWLFVYYQEKTGDALDPNLALGLRDRLSELYYNGDKIDPSRVSVSPRTFLGHAALEILGLYQNLDPPMGGLFKLICFHAGDRLYLIDMAVYNPPGDKIPQLRTLEAIARTFQESVRPGPS